MEAVISKMRSSCTLKQDLGAFRVEICGDFKHLRQCPAKARLVNFNRGTTARGQRGGRENGSIRWASPHSGKPITVSGVFTHQKAIGKLPACPDELFPDSGEIECLKGLGRE